MKESSADKFNQDDARRVAAYLGTKWADLDGDEVEHARLMAYRNILKQRKAGERIELRTRYVETWRALISAESSSD